MGSGKNDLSETYLEMIREEYDRYGHVKWSGKNESGMTLDEALKKAEKEFNKRKKQKGKEKNERKTGFD